MTLVALAEDRRVLGGRGGCLDKDMREVSSVMEMLYLLIRMWVTWTYPFVTVYPVIHKIYTFHYMNSTLISKR